MAKQITYEEFLYRVNEPIVDAYGHSPIQPLLTLLEGKWKMKILYALCCLESPRFNQILTFVDGITPALLTKNLLELVDFGFVSRHQRNEKTPHVEYSLTPKGKDLLPIFYEMMNFGLSYKIKERKNLSR